MAVFDLSREELESYAPVLPEPDDLDAFWQSTLGESRGFPLDVSWRPVDTGLRCVCTWDVTFPGFGGHPIRGWLHLPVVVDRQADAGLPAVVQFQGYGGGRGRPHETILWAAAGYAHFVMDTRGQGSGWSVGETPDPVGSDPAHPGSMTRGVLDPREYYYRRLITDAVRAVDTVRSHPDVNPAQVAVTGISQGGGLTLAVASLVPDVAAVMADVPFLAHFRRAIEITDRHPYAEVAKYLAIHREHVDTVLTTLSYVDVAILARRAIAPALFSVALMDETCPPSTVYAAYHAYGGPKQISVYPYNDHEGGQQDHIAVQLRWLDGVLGHPDADPA